MSILNMIIFFSSTVSKLPKRGIFGHKFKVLFWMKFCSSTNLKGRKSRGKKINCRYRNLFNFVALSYLGNLFYDLLRHLIPVTLSFLKKKKKLYLFLENVTIALFRTFHVLRIFFRSVVINCKIFVQLRALSKKLFSLSSSSRFSINSTF